ncbi:MAG: dihydroorotase [Nitrospinota bacterium]
MWLCIKGGRAVDPARGVDAPLDVLIEEGRVSRLGRDISPPEGARVLDARGLVVAPGFLDMHVHLREPGQEWKEDIASGTRAAARGGFTAVACMPNTHPPNDTSSITERILKRAREVGAVRVYPIGAVSMGLGGESLSEMGDQREAGAVAFSDDGFPVRTGQLMRCALEYSRMLDVPIIEHAEDLSLSGGGAMNEGLVSTELGLQGMPATSEEVVVGRDILLAELTGGRLHIAHISTARAVELVRGAKGRGVRVSCEVTPHHFTLTEEALREYNRCAKMSPPLRTEADREALLEGLRDGTIEVIASDHAPHHEAEREVEFEALPFGVVGLETEVSLALDRLYHGGILTLPELIEKFTAGPARILGVEGGTLEPGGPGDLTLLDLEGEAAVDVRKFASKGRNSPFHGWRLKGAPAAAVVAGKVVWEREDA